MSVITQSDPWGLTQTEREVMQVLFREADSVSDAAKLLGLKVKTVNECLRVAHTKMGFNRNDIRIWSRWSDHERLCELNSPRPKRPVAALLRPPSKRGALPRTLITTSNLP